jgi:hypothetical protein
MTGDGKNRGGPAPTNAYASVECSDVKKFHGDFGATFVREFAQRCVPDRRNWQSFVNTRPPQFV